MCHRRRIPRKPVSDKQARDLPRRTGGIRTGPLNDAPSVYRYTYKLKMLGTEVTEGKMPRKEDIDAAMSFVHSVRPGNDASSLLEAEHLKVLTMAVVCLEQKGHEVEEVKDMLMGLLECKAVDREGFYKKAGDLFSHLGRKA